MPCPGSCRDVLWHRSLFSAALFAGVLLLESLLPNTIRAAWGAPAAVQSSPSSGRVPGGSEEIVFQGKLCSLLKRQVILPFAGVVGDVKFECGQFVKEGTVLASYRLAPDVPFQLRRRLSPPVVGDLEIRLAEVDRNLAEVASRRQEAQRLAAENMAPSKSLSKIQTEIDLLTRQRRAIQDRLNQEKVNIRDDAVLLKNQLGVTIDSQHIPEEAVLRAPIDGHVIWISPDLRKGSLITENTPVVVVGVLEPMVMRAQVHEKEAMHLSVGDSAVVEVESIAAQGIEAKITRVLWATSTPSLDQPSYYDVELTIPNPGLAFKEGMKAQASVRKSKK